MKTAFLFLALSLPLFADDKLTAISSNPTTGFVVGIWSCPDSSIATSVNVDGFRVSVVPSSSVPPDIAESHRAFRYKVVSGKLQRMDSTDIKTRDLPVNMGKLADVQVKIDVLKKTQAQLDQGSAAYNEAQAEIDTAQAQHDTLITLVK